MFDMTDTVAGRDRDDKSVRLLANWNSGWITDTAIRLSAKR